MCVRHLGLKVAIGLLKHGIIEVIILLRKHCCLLSILVDVGINIHSSLEEFTAFKFRR